MDSIRVIIPAAGKGSRLQRICGDLPKAMFSVANRPILDFVLNNVSFIDKENTYIVVGYGKEKIINYFGDTYNYVEQKQQLGTGHAVMECAKAFEDFDGNV
ncbi:MAG: NTP transferase domain-containing protein [Clostridia bacterium]|nr:NTP transferase domain-containing protein [Clostridia bacterium]